MSTLYQLTEAYQELLSMALDPDVDPEALADTMEAIEGEFEDKADGYAKVMKEMKVFEDAKREEGKRQIDGANALKAKRERMSETLANAMKLTGKTKFKTAFAGYNIQKNPPALKIDDPSKVPDEFLIPQEPKIDSAAIKKELKEGVVYDWCHLEQSESLRIR